MHKNNYIIVALLISILIVPGFVSASTTNAGITPDSYWYFFDKAIERIDIALTFNSEKKAEKLIQKAEERLAELKELSQKESFEDIDSLVKEYEEDISDAGARLEKLKDKEKSAILLSSIEESTSEHQDILNDILALVPEEAKQAIQDVIDSNLERQSQLESKIDQLEKENEELKKEIEEMKNEDVNNDEGNTSEENKIPEKSVTTNTGLKLYIDASGNEIKLNWEVFGLDTTKGFKLVEGYSENPVYPGDSATFLNGDQRNHSKVVKGGKVYNYRLCIYTGNGCGVYSNNVKIWIPETENSTSVKEAMKTTTAAGEVKSISLYADGNRVKWMTEGYSSQGHKVVWSKNPNPTYPTRGGDKYLYLLEPSLNTTTLDAFDGEGVYYVRTCEYLGGACGIYSNQVEVNLYK